MSVIASLQKIPKDFWLLCLATVFFYSATHTLTTMLPLYVPHLGYGADVSGGVLALFLVVSVITRPWVGKLYDERPPRELFIAGIFFFVVGTLVLLLFPSSIIALIIARVFQGIGFSIFNSTSYSFATQILDDKLQAQGIGIFSSSIKIAMGYAPAIGWILADKSLFIPTMWVSLAFSLLTMGSISQIKSARSRLATSLKIATDKPLKKGRLFNAKAVFPGVLIATNSFVYGALIPFVPLIVAGKGLTHVEGFHFVYALAIVASRLFGGGASDRLGRFFTIVPGFGVLIIGLLWINYSQSTWQFLLATALYGIGSGVIQPSIVALVADRTQREERGSAMATYTMHSDFGQAAGMLAMGYMGKLMNFNAGLDLAALVVLGGLLLAVFYCKSHPIQKTEA